MRLSLSLLVLPLLLCTAEDAENKENPVYGVDVSYPMHHETVTTNYPWLPWNVDPNVPIPDKYKDMPIQPLGDKQKFYEDNIEGCYEYYKRRGDRCKTNEYDRVEMMMRQPKSMYNYTKLGYTKIRAPEHVFQFIKNFWETNKGKEVEEKWSTGNTYVNHWDVPSYMLSVENESLEGGGYVLKQHIWNAARDTISEWTGQQLAECSLYGIRIYKEGAVLAPHVDRLPLVSSAIINVDQDVDEPWPLEVIGHDGIAVNITMVPGDLVLYESHSVIHGRQFPLKGRFMANVFIHFEPIGAVGDDIVIDPDLPGYIIRGSEEEDNWRRNNPDGYHLQRSDQTTGSTIMHQVAGKGNTEEVKRLLEERGHLVNARDINGWMPIHEAVRGGHIDTIKVLLDHGADVNARTRQNKGAAGAAGGSTLWWARNFHEENHEVIELLKSHGAKSFAPAGREGSEL